MEVRAVETGAAGGWRLVQPCTLRLSQSTCQAAVRAVETGAAGAALHAVVARAATAADDCVPPHAYGCHHGEGRAQRHQPSQPSDSNSQRRRRCLDAGLQQQTPLCSSAGKPFLCSTAGKPFLCSKASEPFLCCTAGEPFLSHPLRTAAPMFKARSQRHLPSEPRGSGNERFVRLSAGGTIVSHPLHTIVFISRRRSSSTSRASQATGGARVPLLTVHFCHTPLRTVVPMLRNALSSTNRANRATRVADTAYAPEARSRLMSHPLRTVVLMLQEGWSSTSQVADAGISPLSAAHFCHTPVLRLRPC